MNGVLAVLAVAQISMAQGVATDRQATLAWRQLVRTPATLRIGPQRPELMRFNRVEGLSIGMRGRLRPTTRFGPLSVSATTRLGLADRHPNARLEVGHETVSRRLSLSGYHELADIDERASNLGQVNSLVAILYGQDSGDYYRRSGATLELTPPSARPRVYRLRAYAEYHEGVAKETDFQLPRLWDDDAAFRPNIAADAGWEVGGSFELQARTSTDPTRLQFGLHSLAQAATGDFDYARARLGVDLVFPLPARFRFLIEGAGGASWGTPSRQRLWYVGGPLTLNGYPPLTAGGKGFGRTRISLDRGFAFGRVVLFSAAAFAGDSLDLDADEMGSSVGIGVALIDGVVRLDGAWRLDSPHDFRLDIYLDPIH